MLFDDADPALWTEGYWPVRELLPAAIAFSIGGALLLRYRKARWPASVLLICGLLAGLSLLFAGLWWDAMMVHGPLAEPLILATDVTLGLFVGLSLTILPQLYPDGPLSGRLWMVLLGVSAGLVVIATLKNTYNFPTIDNLAEWYFWSTLVGLGWLIALASLFVRWRRGTGLLRRQIVGFTTVTVIMIAVLFLSTAYGPFPYLEPRVVVALWPLAVVIAIAVAVLQYHLYDVRLVIRRVVVYGGLTIALTALFVGVYFAVLADPLGPGRGSALPLGGRGCCGRRGPGCRAGAAAHPDPAGAPVSRRTWRSVAGVIPAPRDPVGRGRGRRNGVQHDHPHRGHRGPFAVGFPRSASRHASRDRVDHWHASGRRAGLAAGVPRGADGRDAGQPTNAR